MASKREKQALDFMIFFHADWAENWDIIVDTIGQDRADEWDEIVGYDPDK